MEHSALVSEIPFVERMQLHDRLRHAKKRRAQQLKAYTQREKRLQKEASVSGKHSGKRGSDTSGATLVSDNSEKTGQQKLLQFSDGVLMMEAVMRNDISEGTNDICINNSVAAENFVTQYTEFATVALSLWLGLWL